MGTAASMACSLRRWPVGGRPAQGPRPVPRLEARGPDQGWSWDIPYLPTSVRGMWLYPCLVIDVWSHKDVAK